MVVSISELIGNVAPTKSHIARTCAVKRSKVNVTRSLSRIGYPAKCTRVDDGSHTRYFVSIIIMIIIITSTMFMVLSVSFRKFTQFI